MKKRFCQYAGAYATGITDRSEMNMIGDKVREYRKKRGLSQQALSNALELTGVYVCRGSVSRIEDKSRTVTDIELYAIVKVLNVTIDELFMGSGD